MKYLLSIILMALTLSACTSGPAYKQAQASGYGYKETAIGENRYRVNFKSRGSDRAEAMDYAMLRAAELTLLEGYDWFIVIDRETQVDTHSTGTGSSLSASSRRDVVQECGLLGCKTTTYPRTEYGLGLDVGNSSQSKIESILEIRLGKGVRPEDGNSYDAREVSKSLKSEYQL